MRVRLLAVLGRPAAPPLAVGIAIATAFIAAETVGVLLLKRLVPMEAFETLYLLGVLVISTVWGLALAVTTSVASALTLAYFRHWPDVLSSPLELANAVVVTVFLVVALVANFVADLARARAVEADESRREARVLAEQQAALRRVATHVARGIHPTEIFTAVTAEMARCLRVGTASVHRYEAADGSFVVVASHAQSGFETLSVGERLDFGHNPSATSSAGIERTNVEHHDPAADASHLCRFFRRYGIGAPIIVDGCIWGAVIVGSSETDPLPPDAEDRIGDFADLIATTLGNVAAGAELLASRARIVAAADDARRRLERDLHDGAQQRLVSLALRVRAAMESVQIDAQSENRLLTEVFSGLSEISCELREISHGIHPSILSKGGIAPALKTLARRSPVPVKLDLTLEQRMPDNVEVAAYYVVAEALTNVAKHAQASEVDIRATVDGGQLSVSICDDGVGGADPTKGSGLIGLIDRVEALGGRMQVASRPGHGTSMKVQLPLPTTYDGRPTPNVMGFP
jgi:signal transduction histidine kinase